MKKLTTFATIGAILLSTASMAYAQSSSNRQDNSANQSTGGSGNQRQDTQMHKNNAGGQQ